jgi:peptidyl-prolyl cis-trans isomerase A (cyclophilin A)
VYSSQFRNKKGEGTNSFAFFLIIGFHSTAPSMPILSMHKLLSRFALTSLLCGGASALNASPYVCMELNVGEICMEMLPESAPNTVANFLRYVNDGRFNSSLVHRSIPGFVIQGGGFTWYNNAAPTLIPTDPPIANELSLSNIRGTVAMARVGTNTSSATSQWFVNLGNNAALDTADGGYTVFARVVKGMSTVDAIAGLSKINLSQFWSAAFTDVPTAAPAGTNPGMILLTQLIYVTRAYETNRNPLLLSYQCSLTSPGDTLTEFCGSTVFFPVQVDGVLYEATMTYVAGRDGLVFAVDKSKLRVITDTGQARATYSAGVLTIPSVRNGPRAFDNVLLDLTSPNPLEFKVRTFTPR